MSEPIPPNSLRGMLAVRLLAVIREFDAAPKTMRRKAAEQHLTHDQLLAAVLTEAALEVLEAEVARLRAALDAAEARASAAIADAAAGEE